MADLSNSATNNGTVELQTCRSDWKVDVVAQLFGFWECHCEFVVSATGPSYPTHAGQRRSSNHWLMRASNQLVDSLPSPAIRPVIVGTNIKSMLSCDYPGAT